MGSDAEVTEADREKAELVWQGALHRYGYSGEVTVVAASLTRVIAQALADERAKAREPFLTLAKEWSSALVGLPGADGAVRLYRSHAARIRRAAEDPT